MLSPAVAPHKYTHTTSRLELSHRLYLSAACLPSQTLAIPYSKAQVATFCRYAANPCTLQTGSHAQSPVILAPTSRPELARDLLSKNIYI